MYAIFKTGGKQYRVSKGDIIFVEKLPLEENETVVFDDVIFINNDDEIMVGSPVVDNAKITAKILKNGKSKKIRVFTYKPKKGYKRCLGHRQPYSKLEIVSISLS